MRKSKVTAIILAMAMAVSLFTIPASAENFTAADALAVLKHVVGIQLLSPEQMTKYGFTDEEAVTSADALSILKTVVGTTDIADDPEPMISGGWSEFRDLTEEDLAVFEEAMADLDGVVYEPISVSTQIVAGMNYRFLCNATVVYPDAETVEKYVTVYKDLEGNVEITEIVDAE